MSSEIPESASHESVLLSDRDIRVLRAAFLTSRGWKYNATAVGEAAGLGAARNRTRTLKVAFAKLGLEARKDGTFSELNEDEATADPATITFRTPLRRASKW